MAYVIVGLACLISVIGVAIFRMGAYIAVLERELTKAERQVATLKRADVALATPYRLPGSSIITTTPKEEIVPEKHAIIDPDIRIEVYTDKAGKHRWRKWINSDIVAASTQGYADVGDRDGNLAKTLNGELVMRSVEGVFALYFIPTGSILAAKVVRG